MKDAKGHGSDGRGTPSAGTVGNHQAGVLRVGRPGTMKVQQLNTAVVAGVPWRTVKSVGPSSQTGRSMFNGRYRQPNARAEAIAQFQRRENRDTLVRLR